MAANWTINNLDRYKSLSGKTDVVFNIHWNCDDKDSNGNSGSCYGTVGLSTDDLSDFTAYADITETKALGWAKAALGDDAVASIEANVAGQIAEKATPTKASGTPW